MAEGDGWGLLVCGPVGTGAGVGVPQAHAARIRMDRMNRIDKLLALM
jgi:hypothetical protein